VTDENAPKPYDLETSVAVGRDEVWETVTQPPVIRQWFGWDYDGLDAEIQQIFVDEATLLAPERMGWADGSFLEVTGDDNRSTVRAVRGEPPAEAVDRWDPIEQGWKVFLVQLRYLLEQAPKGLRRTLYLTGTSTGRQALGLAAGDWTRVGTRVAWVVDADGHLVVVSGRQPLDSPDAAHIEIIVSTFGSDDATFDAYRDAWSKRWAPLAGGAAVTLRDRS
jgi:uncharacterized protein YndB with AHSA1/START domain